MPKGPAQPLHNKQFKKPRKSSKEPVVAAEPVVEAVPVVETKELSLTSDVVHKPALTGPLTPESLDAYQTEVMVRSARTLIPGLMRSLRAGLRNHDKDARALVASMYNFTAKSGTPSIVTNIQNNYSPAGSAKKKEDVAEAVYFESIVRGLDAEANRAKDKQDIIDAEIEEVK